MMTKPSLVGGPGGKGVAVGVGVAVGGSVGSSVGVPLGVRIGEVAVADGVHVAPGDGVPEGVGPRGVRVGVGVGSNMRGRQAASSAITPALLSALSRRRRLRRVACLWFSGSLLKMVLYPHIPNYIPNMFGI